MKLSKADKFCLENGVRIKLTTPAKIYNEMEKIGEVLFNIETTEGLPFNIGLEEILKKQRYKKLKDDDISIILSKYQTLKINHMEISGAEKKNVLKSKEKNKKEMYDLYHKGREAILYS